MPDHHSLLLRQLKRRGLVFEEVPEPYRGLLEAVDEAYAQFDDDRGMIERSLELSSQELLQANSEMRALFLALPDLLFLVDRDGIVLEVKGSSKEDLSRPSHELIGRSILSVPDHEVAERFREAFHAVRETKVTTQIEYSLEMRGQRQIYEARFVPLLVDQTIIIVRNVTEQRRAVTALRESERRYRIVSEATSELIYDYDTASGLIKWAGAVETITGWEPEEFAAVDTAAWEELIHPDDRAQAISALDAAAVTSTPFHTEYRFRRRDGQYVHIEDNGVFLIESGEVVRLLGAMKDVSERVRAQDEKRKVEEQLRQAMKMEAIGRLAGGVAHDFNNILTSITGHTGLLLDALPPGDPFAADVLDIQRAAERAAALTTQLLVFSRKQVIAPRVLDLNELVRRSARMIERMIGEDIHLDLRLAAEHGRVRADATQLEQAIVNLAVNARDAMPRGGSLTLETHNAEVDEERCRRNPDASPGRHVVLEVRDTGSGMDETTLDRLFEPFFTTKEPGKGTGLGLSMVYGVVLQNKGFIEVESGVGVGTTFRLHFPFMDAEAEAVHLKDASNVPKGRETVLLVEDDDMVRRLAVRILQHQGYVVIQASRPTDAIPLFEKLAPEIDLLLTDVVMPGMNGLDLYTALAERKPGLKVLYMSGYQQDVLAHHGVLEPGTHFLAKPFTLGELARTIREVLDEG